MRYKFRGVSAFLFMFIIAIFPILSLYAVNFSELNLSQDDRLLFKAEFESQNSVFVAVLTNNNSMQQLTAFPEKFQLVDNGRSLIVINRFGAARVPVSGGLPAPLAGYPSFMEGNMPLRGRLQEAAASNDGRWITFIEPVSPAYGTLYILNTSNGTKRIVTENIELPAADFPVKWSPDSRLFVYAKDNTLYYFPIISDLSVLVDERFRLMGDGNINSIAWGQQGDFFYFSENTLYSVKNPELFTRTIYGDFLSIGHVASILPFGFDPNFDKFWVAPNSNAILINKNNKGIFLFELDRNNGNPSLLQMPLQAGAENFNVLWSSSGKGKILYTVNDNVAAIHFEITESNVTAGHYNRRIYPEIDIPISANGALSPDGTKAVFWGERGLELWDFENWELTQRLFNEPIYSCAWINNERFITGTQKFILEINISGNITQRRICLSKADEVGFETATRIQSRVLARIGTEWFATDTRSGWVPVTDPQLRQHSLVTDRYRAYLESNNIMIRNLQGFGTFSLLQGHARSNAYPQRNQIRIALCFDLYDDDTGLYRVLSALKRHNMRATFFLNGEFIRRNPQSARAIAESGHETGSMFYAPIDLSLARYRITQEFIVRGLSRNEDEYFNATGKELGLLWHPPFYRTSDFINSAAASANYIYIPRTFDPRDWLSNTESARLNIRQLTPSQMIEQIIEQGRNGAVIPIRLGMLAGGRDEYLFQRIDVLLDAFVRSGIEVVPVSAVGEEVRLRY